MFQVSLLALTLWSGTLAGPYRVADAEPRHHQVSLRAAMAADGRFAIAWDDSVRQEAYPGYKTDLYIRYFDKDGNPMTDPYGVKRLEDISHIRAPALEMDSLGNAILLWEDDWYRSDTYYAYVRFQHFGSDGTPRDTAKTLSTVPGLDYGGRPLGLSSKGEFVVVTSIWTKSTPLGTGIWVQRFNLKGEPLDTPFLAHQNLDSISDSIPRDSLHDYEYPCAALNDEGDLVVTWLDIVKPNRSPEYPRYQVFDSQDSPILWDSLGHCVDDSSAAVENTPNLHWIASDRFVVFWTDYLKELPPDWAVPLIGRVFSQRGTVKHPTRVLMRDLLGGARFSTSVLADGRFAETHTRFYDKRDTATPYTHHYWQQTGGILGQVVDDEPWRRTTLFEYSAPFGADTLFTNWYHYNLPIPAVAASDDRIAWVYSRFNPDSIFEAWAVVSDWDMGVGLEEKPLVTHQPDFEIANPIGSQIVLKYSDHPQGFRASVFDASGRKVDEIQSAAPSGTLTWGEGHSCGVYFICPASDASRPAQRVILVR